MVACVLVAVTASRAWWRRVGAIDAGADTLTGDLCMRSRSVHRTAALGRWGRRTISP